MEHVRAIVIGVSRYEVDGWAIPGAARNAGLIAARLLNLGLQASRLHLFADAEDLTEELRAFFEARDVDCQGTGFDEIDRFWRNDLAREAAIGDSLFVFWSGHGMTDRDGQRVFFCSDYGPNLPGRVFNATKFGLHLKAPPFASFADQLIVADVCGTYANVSVAPANDQPGQLRATRQLTLYATPEGAYAREKDGTGMFSQVVDAVLGETTLDPWPAQNSIVEAFNARTADWTHAPMLMRWSGDGGSDEVRLGVSDERSQLARALLDLLGGYPIPESVSTRAFVNTVRNLGLAAAPDATLPETISELTDLDDDWNQGAPFALVQFLTRMLVDPDLPPDLLSPLEKWIVRNSLTYVVKRANDILAAERQTMLLLIEIDTHPVSGELSGVTAKLRYPDLSPVPGFGTLLRPAHDQASLEACIKALIDEDVFAFSPDTLEIHFLLDPPAFGWSYQEMPIMAGEMLGDEYVCVAHYRRRAKARGGPIVEEWQNWAEELADDLDVEALHELPPAPSAVPSDRGIFYVEAPIGAANNPVTWRQIDRLLRLGAPYLCWPVAATDATTSFSTKLRTLIGDTPTFERMPARVLKRRLGGCSDARAISILWDRPGFRPYDFQDLKGVT